MQLAPNATAVPSQTAGGSRGFHGAVVGTWLGMAWGVLLLLARVQNSCQAPASPHISAATPKMSPALTMRHQPRSAPHLQTAGFASGCVRTAPCCACSGQVVPRAHTASSMLKFQQGLLASLFFLLLPVQRFLGHRSKQHAPQKMFLYLAESMPEPHPLPLVLALRGSWLQHPVSSSSTTLSFHFATSQ